MFRGGGLCRDRDTARTGDRRGGVAEGGCAIAKKKKKRSSSSRTLWQRAADPWVRGATLRTTAPTLRTTALVDSNTHCYTF